MTPPEAEWDIRVRSVFKRIPASRLPIVIELAGMPRLGKTVSTDSLIGLLKRSGCSTMLSAYATHSSPIHERWSFDFSAWTFFSFLKGFLELKHSATQVLVADRGLFDSMTWLRLKLEDAKLDSSLLAVFGELAQAPPWHDSICLVLAFVGDKELILRRTRQRKLYKGESQVSTEQVLSRLAGAIEAEAEAWNAQGINVVLFPVGDEPVEDMIARVADKVVGALEGFAKSLPTS